MIYMKVRINRKSRIYRLVRDVCHWWHLNRINRSQYHTDKHIVVIESDDWGSVRTFSSATLDKLRTAGDTILTDPFLRYDCLESEKDLDALSNVLSEIHGSDGNPAVMTANFAMANADFDSIKKTGRYHRETIAETYKKYYGNNHIIEKIIKYRDAKVFVPQLHCLEHLNVNRWMNDLKTKRADTLVALENNMYGVSASFTKKNPFGYMDAFNYIDVEERTFLAQSIQLASEWFQKTFGQASESFVASCYVWDEYLEKELVDLNICHIQTAVHQHLPFYYSFREDTFRKRRHKMGARKRNGIYYTIRNCEFEPVFSEDIERAKERCVFQIKNAFSNRVPAIIASHRVNYIGGIDESNRERNLVALKELLTQIVHQYPDVIFMSSDELGRKILTERYEHQG